MMLCFTSLATLVASAQITYTVHGPSQRPTQAAKIRYGWEYRTGGWWPYLGTL